MGDTRNKLTARLKLPKHSSGAIYRIGAFVGTMVMLVVAIPAIAHYTKSASAATPGTPTVSCTTTSSTTMTLYHSATNNPTNLDIDWALPYTNSQYVAGSYTQLTIIAAPNPDSPMVLLMPGALYRWRVTAYNTDGYSSPAFASCTTSPGRPNSEATHTHAPPFNLYGPSISGNSASLSWSAPHNGGSPVTYYIYANGSNIGSTSSTSYNVNNLSYNTYYSFSVRASNSYGSVDSQNTVSGTTGSPPVTNPSAPYNMYASAQSSSSIYTSWSPPTSDGGAPISYYNVYRNGSYIGISYSTSYTDTGLSPGTYYSYSVSAYNTGGYTSGTSGSAGATTFAAAPNTPGTPGTTRGNKSIGLSWSAPANNGSTITDYYVQYATSSGGPWTTYNDGVSSSTSTTVSGLSDATTYYFRVAAVNGVGASGYSGVGSGATWSVPNTPNAPTITRGNKSIGVSWTAPANGGTAITDYSVQFATTSTGPWMTFTDGVSTATSTTVTGLSDASTYYFRVAAINVIGTSSYSTVTAGTTWDVPSTPDAPTANRGNKSISLSWTAPANGGSAITDYRIEYSPDGFSWLPFNDGVSTSTNATVTGLTDNTTYQFRVAATNVIGSSSFSLPVSATTWSIPDAPSSITTIPRNGEVGLSWTTPANGGGTVISDYIIEFSSNGGTTWATYGDPVSSATTAVVSGLNANTEYQFRVSSVNVIGTSGPSPPASSYTLHITSASPDNPGPDVTTPVTITGTGFISGQPLSVTISGLGTFPATYVSPTEISFTAPPTGINGQSYDITVTQNGYPSNTITGGLTYEQQVPTISGISPQAGPSTGGTTVTVTGQHFVPSSTVTVDGIPAGSVTFVSSTQLTFTTPPHAQGIADIIITSNTVSSIESGTANDFAYAAPPDSPTGLISKPTDGGVFLDWDAPANDGGAPIKDYQIEYSSDGGTTWTVVSDGISTTTSGIVGGLSPGIDYVFRVSASNDTGVGTPSNTTTSQTLHLTGLSNSTTDPAGGNTIIINGSGFLPGVPITVTIPGLGTVPGTYISPTQTSFITPSGTMGQTYDVYVTQDGQNSNTLTNIISYIIPPSAPRNITTIPADDHITVNWDPPLSDGGRPITDYIIEYSSDGGTTWVVFPDGTGAGTTVDVTGLTPGVDYVFKITPVNSVGDGTSATTGTTATRLLYLSFNTGSSVVPITVTPLVDTARMSSNSHVTTTTTNSSTGYRVLLSMDSTDTQLTAGTHTIPASNASLASPTALSSDTWGYRVDNNSSFGGSATSVETNKASSSYTWAGVPILGSEVPICSSTSPAPTGAPCKVWYAIKASPALPNATYTGTVVYTALVN